jgi:polyhydroxyalkanoate synthesis regulator phasin
MTPYQRAIQAYEHLVQLGAFQNCNPDLAHSITQELTTQLQAQANEDDEQDRAKRARLHEDLALVRRQLDTITKQRDKLQREVNYMRDQSTQAWWDRLHLLVERMGPSRVGENSLDVIERAATELAAKAELARLHGAPMESRARGTDALIEKRKQRGWDGAE